MGQKIKKSPGQNTREMTSIFIHGIFIFMEIWKISKTFFREIDVLYLISRVFLDLTVGLSSKL